MLDIKKIRSEPEAFDEACARRGLTVKAADISQIDARLRKVMTELQNLQSERNRVAKEIGKARAAGDAVTAEKLTAEVAAHKETAAKLETEQGLIAEELYQTLSTLPNLIAFDTPDGKDEADNVEIRRFGTPRPAASFIKPHDDVAGEGADFETAAGVSGARFVFLKGEVAKLERALANFMLDTQTQEFGYTEVSPPLLVRAQALFGTGQLPKFEEDLFKTTDDRYLIPTAEAPLTNIVREKILSEAELPLRFTALTPCFRSEAGSAGRDVRGMFRQHQFYKVETVSITAPEYSDIEHERMTECAESILKKLDLPYRTVVLCAGDTGFSAQKTYDIEVWLPAQEKYREISSCSNCGDFQALRMNARFKDKDGKNRPVHTLNGSGLAVGRTLIAVLENYQNEDGSVTLPLPLRSYFDGKEKILAAA